MVFIIKLNKSFKLCFWDVTSWYRSLGLRDSGTLSGVSELKLRNWYKNFQKENLFFVKRSFEKRKEF